MMVYWAALVVVAVTLAPRTSSGHNLTEVCKRESHGFTCQVFNTTQNVVVGSGSEVTDGASQHPAVLCPTTIDKSDNFSENIMLRKDAASPSPNRTMANVTAARTSPGGKTSVTSRRVPGTLPQPGRDCEVKVSVQNSTVHRVQGHFVEAKFYNSRVIDFDGDYMHLDVKNTSVSNMSLSGRIIEMEDSKIEYISQLKADKYLHLRRTTLGTVAPRGLLLHSPGRGDPQRPSLLSDVTVQRLEEDSLVVAGGTVNLTNMTVGWMARDAIRVRSKGLLTLTNVVLHSDEYHCLQLERGARLVIKNLSIRGNIIYKMDLTPSKTIYPLVGMTPKEGGLLFVPFDWYWVLMMIACGIVAGMVIGSALMWKRPSLRNGPTSVLTLSDLLSHDRLQQNNAETERQHITDHMTRPTLTRQDSGLTSSSFASYKHLQSSRTDVELGTSSSYSNNVRDDM